MRLFENINRRFIWIAATIVFLLSIITFPAAFAKEDGSLGNGFIKNLSAATFDVLLFPFHTLLTPLMDLTDEISKPITGVLYFIILLGNCAFYAFVFERVFYYTNARKRKENNPPENLA